MAVTLGTFILRDDGSYTGVFRTLNINKAIMIVPVDKASDNAPTHRVYTAGQRYDYAKRSVMRSGEARAEVLRALEAVCAPHNSGPWSGGAVPSATPQRPDQRDQTSA
jgi:Protein of unknown function (DUF736)